MIKILNIENGNPDHEALLSRAVVVLDALLASPFFEQEFLKLIMVPKVRQKNGEYKKLNMSNKDIWNALDSVPIEFNVEFRERDRAVPGSADEESNTVSLNTKYFQPEKLASIAGTILHEYWHLIGFDHDGSKDYDSVPYAAGHLVKRLLRKYPYKGGKLKTVNRGFPLCFLKTTKWV